MSVVDVRAAPGRLWLVPNTLDLGSGQATPLSSLLPPDVTAQAARLAHWVVEDAKVARAFLGRVSQVVPLARPLRQIDIVELPRAPKGRPDVGGDAATERRMRALLAPAWAGDDLGLLSDAGMPAVADPGAALVAAAHEAGVEVRPLVGPSALLLALAASGLDGQRFAFVGYLPVDADERARRLQALEATSRRERQTQLAIETPYRQQALFEALLRALAPTTRLTVAQGLTLEGGRCVTRRVAQWRAGLPFAFVERQPSVFAWLAA